MCMNSKALVEIAMYFLTVKKTTVLIRYIQNFCYLIILFFITMELKSRMNAYFVKILKKILFHV